jgi:hypothetical protein
MKKIHFDEKSYKAELANWENLIDVVNTFGKELEPHGLELNSELLGEFLVGPTVDALTGIRKGWPFQGRLLQATLDRFPGATPLMIQGFTREAESIAASFNHYRKEMRDAARNIGIDPATVTIKDGRAIISKEIKSELTEKHTSYLADRDAEAYERMQKFAAGLNELQDFLAKELHPLKLADALGGEREVKPPDLLETLGEISGGETFENTRLPFLNRSGQVVVNPRYFGYRTKKMSNDKNNTQ